MKEFYSSRPLKAGVGLITAIGVLAACSSPPENHSTDSVIKACPSSYPATPLERERKIANTEQAYAAIQAGVAKLIAKSRVYANGAMVPTLVSLSAVRDIFPTNPDFTNEYTVTGGNSVDSLGEDFCTAAKGVYESPHLAQVIAELGVAGITVDLRSALAFRGSSSTG